MGSTMTPAEVPPDNVTPNAPERIWLQADTTGDAEDRSEPLSPEHWDELTWCAESLGGVEVEYVRVDKVAALVAERNSLQVGHDALLTVREALRRECDALRGELAMIRPSAERYALLRDGHGWPAVFGSANDPEPLRGFLLDEACNIAQRAALAGAGK